MKFLTAVVAATLIAAVLTFVPGVMPSVAASTRDEAVTQQPAAKADRLPLRAIGAACSPRAWPYYERECLFDKFGWANEGRPVRVVTTDRVAGR